jgi:hypothetical protein
MSELDERTAANQRKHAGGAAEPEVVAVDKATEWQEALAKRKKHLATGKEVVIYRKTVGPPMPYPDNYRLWRQTNLGGKGDEFGLKDFPDYNKGIGYLLFRIPDDPSKGYIPENNSGKLADAVTFALGGGGAGPPSDVGPR